MPEEAPSGLMAAEWLAECHCWLMMVHGLHRELLTSQNLYTWKNKKKCLRFCCHDGHQRRHEPLSFSVPTQQWGSFCFYSYSASHHWGILKKVWLYYFLCAHRHNFSVNITLCFTLGFASFSFSFYICIYMVNMCIEACYIPGMLYYLNSNIHILSCSSLWYKPICLKHILKG